MAIETRLDMMTDGEINAELKAATGDRLEELQAEMAERRQYRADWQPDTTVGWRGKSRARP